MQLQGVLLIFYNYTISLISFICCELLTKITAYIGEKYEWNRKTSGNN